MVGRLPVTRINQIALVVRDLDAAMRRYWETLRIGPWVVYTYGPPLVKDMTYRGRAQDYRMRLALAQAGDMVLELIQPLSSENIYSEHLAHKGEGLHHIGVFVPSLDGAVAEATRQGFAVLQSGRGYGRRGDGGYAYLDTEGTLGLILELIEVPQERIPPERTYPPS
jgi:methylmalonyl-CoA/ethylmalonyl-CoA epimerase